MKLIQNNLRDFPGGPVIGVPCCHCRGKGSIPDQGTKITQAMGHGQRKTKNKQTNKKFEIIKDTFKTRIARFLANVHVQVVYRGGQLALHGRDHDMVTMFCFLFLLRRHTRKCTFLSLSSYMGPCGQFWTMKCELKWQMSLRLRQWKLPGTFSSLLFPAVTTKRTSGERRDWDTEWPHGGQLSHGATKTLGGFYVSEKETYCVNWGFCSCYCTIT